MKKFQTALVATVVMSSSVLPFAAQAQTKHRTLKTAAAGVGAYELAKHSHSRFLHKHRVAAGIAAAMVAHHYMKKHKN